MDTIEKNNIGKLELILSITAISILPFMMYLHLYDPKLEKYDWFSNQSTIMSDFFLHIKMCFIIVLGILMLGVIFFNKTKKKISLTLPTIYWFLGGYLLFAILSAIFSVNKEFSFKGSYEQFQPIGVLITYGIVNIFTYYFINNVDSIKKVVNIWGISILILSALGFLQFIGKDPLNSSFIKKIITPRQYWADISEISLVTESNRTYLTFFNPNYVGLFASFTIPIFLVLFLGEKKWKKRLMYAFVLIGLTVCTIGSRSKNTVIALIIPIILAIIILRDIWKNNFKVIIIGIVVSIFIILGLNAMGGNLFGKSIIQAFKVQDPGVVLENITMSKKGVTIQFKDSQCTIDYTLNSDNTFLFQITNENGEQVENHYDISTNSLIIDDEKYYNISIMPVSMEDTYGFAINYNGKYWIFKKDSQNNYEYYNSVHKWTTLQTAKSVDIFPNTLFTGRGYVWNRTIPLLKETLLLGTGPDTFVITYPQDDYVSNYNQGYENTVVTKPHSLYLQIGVETGVLSLACFLAFYFYYFIQSVKLYWKCQFEGTVEVYGFAIFMGTIGFMISSIVNDSTVCVSPIFWTILGIGIGINSRLKTKMV